VQNVVPVGADSVEAALADRALTERREHYVAEVRRLIDAAFVVMSRTGSIEPQVRDIVREAGLSNQAFYRHFASRDALLLAVLADGRRQLVAYLQSRLAATTNPAEQLRRYVDGIMAQARDDAAAAATRPFAIDGNRLAAQFPEEVAASKAELLDLLRPAVHALGGDDRDIEVVHDLTMARMHDALVERRRPDRREVQHLVRFCLAGIEVRDGT
jgi:AcrR family transcriptional regulator